MSIRVNKTKFKFLIFTISMFIIYTLIYEKPYYVINQDSAIYTLSFMGALLLILILLSWKKITKKLISPYTIFIIFVFLFNYGQCLMWALGIHLDNEIGKVSLYTFPIPSENSIIRTQLITLMGITSLHCGALIGYKNKINILCTNKKGDSEQESKILYRVCVLLSIIVVPITYYIAYQNYIIANSGGYGAIYYGEGINRSSTLILISKMFFPCLLGILIGSNYSSLNRKIVYSIYIIYIIISALAGDRGEWLYGLILMCWMHNNYYKKLNIKKLIIYIISGIALISVLTAIRDIRSEGVSLEGIIKTIGSAETNPIISAFFELGSSMRVNLLLVEHGWDIYPYGNTYILAIMGMITEKFITMLGIPYKSISQWFSQEYIGISYGAGFSIIAESLINYGPYVSIFFLALQGYIFSKFLIVENIDIKKEPVSLFLRVSTTSVLISAARNMILNTLKNWVFSVLIIYIIVLVVKYMYKK